MVGRVKAVIDAGTCHLSPIENSKFGRARGTKEGIKIKSNVNV